MEPISTEAVVLRYADYNEADRMVTLFSPEYGKLSAAAKGVKRQKAKLRYAAELFHYGEYILTQSHNRFIITQCNTKESFFPLRSNLEKLWSATFMLNVCEAFIREQQEDKELFGLLLGSLYQAAFNERLSVKQLINVFILKALNAEGLAPDLTECIRCGKKVDTDALFSFLDGGICCSMCKTDSAVMPVSIRSIGLMNQILSAGFENSWELAMLYDKPEHEETYQLLTRYLQLSLDKNFKVLDYIRHA